MQGTIQRVIRGKGFGFIFAENRQYFFHHTEVQNAPFKRLATGDTVEFQARDEDVEGRNPRAVDVVLVVKRERPASTARRGGRGRTRPPTARGGALGAFSGPRASGSELDDEFGPGLPDGADGADGSDGPEGPEGPDADDLEFVDGVDAGESRPRAPQKRRPPQKRPARRLRAAGAPGERGEGVVRFLDPGRGFGFIRTSAGDVFFDRDSVRGGMERIARGSHVAFVFGDGERGARADQIAPLG